MPSPDGAPLIADGQPPTAAHAPALQNFAAVFGLHTMEESMLTTTWNAFRLPGSLRHCFYSSHRRGTLDKVSDGGVLLYNLGGGD